MAPASSLKSWEDFLWEEYHAVAVPALNTDCQMLSVLVKRPAKWPHRSKYVEKLDDAWGITLAAGEGALSCKETYKAFKDQLSKGVKVDPDAYAPFSYEDLHDIEQVVKTSTSLGALLNTGLSGAGKVEAGLQHTKSLTVTAKGVFSHKFEGTTLMSAIGAGKWKPQAPALLEDGEHIMWIINEVYYAESIDVDFQDGGSVKAEVAAMPVIPGGLGAGVNASGDKDAHLSINGGAGKEPRPFAFKALPFGIKKVTNVGETISYKRDSTGRILPQSSRPTRPTEPETVHSGGDKGKGKASHPTVKHLTADFASMSFNVIENERDQMDNFRNIASMPIVFGAPEEGT